ncbi:membrane metallo-endopeptidase-like 1 isoform X2 [Leptopilina heterotoma]|uniref:membrane metallo-endopeptidase-like 1 isoform X2 n=1 Tax=Leptopilina heterotoma TaxID=63436 RepID=UPI001CA9E75C|nr:membrane metallo-endopeptidase-like 1 isoform X2 [Leptopilina heterotoma]
MFHFKMIWAKRYLLLQAMLSTLIVVYSFDMSVDDIDILENENIHSHRRLLSMERKYFHACMNVTYSLETEGYLYQAMVRGSEEAGPNWQNVAEFYANRIGEISLFHVTLGPNNELEILRPSQTVSNLLAFQAISGFIDIYLANQNGALWFHEMRATDDMFKRDFKRFVQLMSEEVHDIEWPLIPVNIGRFQEMYDESCLSPNSVTQINWLHFLRILAGQSGDMLTNLHTIYIDWSYLKKMCKALSSTSNDVIVRYLQFNFEVDQNILFYVNGLLANMGYNERSYNCILKMPLSTGYYNVLSSEENISPKFSYLTKLLDVMKSELNEQIQNSWFEDGLKSKAETVVNGIHLWFSNMGFPMTRREIESISYNFEVDNTALGNLINYKRAQTVHKFNLFLTTTTKRRNKRDIEMNAFYMPRRNLMVMSPAFLFPPFFHTNAPVAYNFGRLGFIIGHEISHAFDYKRLIPILGYNAENAREFSEDLRDKLDCFTDQFDGLNMESGYNTLIENIADTQGLKLAFRAMRRLIMAYPHIQDQRLGNLDAFHTRKLFFIAFANLFCESGVDPYVSATHSPAKLRVIGTLQNMKEFATTFKCARGRPMNPRGERCDFWKY